MIQFHVDVAPIKKALGEFGRQVNFAAAGALADAAKVFQDVQRNWTGQIFRGRQGGWVRASVKIVHFPTKVELYADIAIAPAGGPQKADIISKFESDTVKLPHLGAHVVVPVGINEGRELREGQRFRDYHFVKQGNRWQDDARKAFMVPIGTGRLLVLQRVDHRVRRKNRRTGATIAVRAHDAMPLFLLVPQVRVTPNLDFYANAAKTLQPAFERAFLPRLQQAIDTAK